MKKLKENNIGTPTQGYGIKNSIGGTLGSPSSDMSTGASRLMQIHEPDDVEDSLTTLREFVTTILFESEILKTDEEDDEVQEEATGCAAIAGYTLPLGMKPKEEKGKKKPHWKASADAFARAKRA